MKPQELRIGNYVTALGKVQKVKEIGSKELVSNKEEYYCRFENKCQGLWFEHDNKNLIKPIPLTEEWLLKFGFIKDKTQIAVYYKGDIEIQLPNYFKYKDSHLRKLKYVHELQNCFYALKETELEIGIYDVGAFYCQRDIEDKSICDSQCDHCKEYYKPLER